MTRNQSLFFRALLFLTGAGIMALAFFLLNAGRIMEPPDVFVWVSVAVMYFVLFVPLFFSSITISNFSGKIPSLSMVWLGIGLYIIASIVLIVLTALRLFSLNISIVIQAVIFFLFLIDVYGAYFASSHVRQVAAEEHTQRYYITEIKSKSGVLALTVNSLPPEYGNVQKSLQKLVEDIKYLYPVDAGMAADLELSILGSLDILSELCGDIASGAKPLALEDEVKRLQTLVKERKLLRS